MGVGVQQGSGATESTSPIPVPGSTLRTDDSVYPGELRNSQQPSYATLGSADLVSQPGLIAQLFPNFLESLLGANRGLPGDERGKPSGNGRVRDRGTRNSEQLRSEPGANAGQRRRVGKSRR